MVEETIEKPLKVGIENRDIIISYKDHHVLGEDLGNELEHLDIPDDAFIYMRLRGNHVEVGRAIVQCEE